MSELFSGENGVYYNIPRDELILIRNRTRVQLIDRESHKIKRHWTYDVIWKDGNSHAALEGHENVIVYIGAFE